MRTQEALPARLDLGIVDRIEWLLRRLGMTQAELCEAVGIHPSTYWSYGNIRKGRTRPSKIPAPVLGRIAKVLGTTTDFLLGLTDDPRPIDSTDSSRARFLSPPRSGPPPYPFDLRPVGPRTAPCAA